MSLLNGFGSYNNLVSTFPSNLQYHMYEQMNKPMHAHVRDKYQNAIEPSNPVLFPRSTNKPLYSDPTRIVTVLRM